MRMVSREGGIYNTSRRSINSQGRKKKGLTAQSEAFGVVCQVCQWAITRDLISFLPPVVTMT